MFPMLMKMLSSNSMEFSLHFTLYYLILSMWILGSGENVIMFCNLTTPEDVLQITWQKMQDSMSENICSYSWKRVEKILPGYLGRLHCDSIEAQFYFITIREVTFDDEACYKCLFNMFPHGSKGGQICLHIITVSELQVELQSIPGSKDVLRATCSATGKPAPKISLFPSQILMNPPKECHALNPEGTVTVTKVSDISLEAAASLGVHHLIVHVDHPLRPQDKLVPLAVKDECLSCCAHGWRYACIGLIVMLCATFAGAIVYTRQMKKKTRKIEDPTPEQAQPLEITTRNPIKRRL